ncbi:MAG: DUF1015 domain-containing protein [Spirochaetaceae bacterium]|jgi:uncharacterized protein (DUF1015 family)|nr:DUF1015 domain-containing protein [Spirochaetaceae bacterium]
MDELELKLSEFAVCIPEVILPAKNVDIEKWSVVACDQWTQDKDYWDSVEDFVGDSPSTLKMIYPEIYLNEAGRAQRIENIHQTMRDYLSLEYTKNQVVIPPRRAGVFLERETKSGVRQGLVAAVDLEKYDWHKGSNTIIRATEGTIPERIPPRMDIRRGAALELPHIMLLIDDTEDMLMSVLQKLLNKAPYFYNSKLMLNSGSVKGRFLYRKNDWSFVADTMELLYRKSCTKYNRSSGFLFAVGDGNHSLATAKAVWEEYKAAHSNDPEIMRHPARYALAEMVNLYDKALKFEPIHRVVFNTDFASLQKELKSLPEFESRALASFEELCAKTSEPDAVKNRIGLVCGDEFIIAEFAKTPIASVQLEPVIDRITQGKAENIDYIHGEDEVLRICRSLGKEAAGIILPPFAKETLFDTVNANGALPRKTFSMGEASEKRFYLECRKIF